MFAALGRFAARRRWWVLVAAVLFVVAGGLLGSGAGEAMGGGAGLDSPNHESAEANAILNGPLGRHAPDVVVIYESAEMTVDDPGFRERVEEVVARIPADDYTWVETYWSTGSADYVSADRHKTYLSMQLISTDEIQLVDDYRVMEAEGLFDARDLTEFYGGLTPVADQFFELSEEGLARAELLSFPLLLLLLLIVFRSVVAAALPLTIAVLVAVGSLAVLRGVGEVVPLSTSAINVVVILGLGLATDYALLIVTRFREELAAGRSVDDAVATTMATAGRTVVVSGVTVAVVLAGLLVFPSRFLQSLAYSGVSVVLFAMLSAITVLPALLRFAGHRIDALRVPLPRLRRRAAGGAGSGWYRTAHAVMRRPVVTTLAIGLLLLAVGLPVLSATWTRPAEWALPPDTDSQVVTRMLAEEFPTDPTKILTGVVRMPGPADDPQAQAALADFAQRLSRVDGVQSAEVTGGYENLGRITVNYSPLSAYGQDVRDVVADLRAEPPPAGATALFTNRPASIADMLQMLGEGLPWMLLIAMVVSFVVLFLAFGSVVLPIKTIIMNLLSLSAALGAMVLIFQHGYGSGLLGFEAPGFIDANFPIMIAAVGFGLAMDYEVFMLARIRENYLRTGDPVESVAVGVQHTARLITAAALLLGVVVGSFVIADVTVIQMIGVGVVIALLVDATIVRGLLVPATMRLLGRWAWWSPPFLARWWEKYGLPEESLRLEEVPDGAPERVRV
jgi:uncharacterized membrane protein YdfJ with MMPL/SSD domain